MTAARFPASTAIDDPAFDAALAGLCTAIRRQQASDQALAEEYAAQAESFKFYSGELVSWFTRRHPVATRENIDTLRRIVQALHDAHRLAAPGRPA